MNPTDPVTHTFADDGRIPNNPKLPLVLYRGCIDLAGTPYPEELVEKTFTANGWGDIRTITRPSTKRWRWRAAAPRCASAARAAK
jgi:hypothetical protein